MATLYEYTDDSGGSGEFISGVAGQDLGEHKLVYLGANSQWFLADADDANKMPVIGLTLGAVPSGVKGRYLLKGYIADASWAWSFGGPTGMIYASATAGDLTQTPPGGTVVAVAIAKTATGILFCFPAVGGGGGGGASDPEHTASYIIWTDGVGNYYSKDGHTGVITSGANAATLTNACITALTAGRTWNEVIYLKGNFTTTAPIEVPSYTTLILDGQINVTADVDGIDVGAFGTVAEQARIIGGTITCTVASTSFGIHAYSRRAVYQDLEISEFGRGVFLDEQGACYKNRLERLKIHNCTQEGLYFKSGDNELYNVESYYNDVGLVQTNDYGGLMATNIHIWQNDDVGVKFLDTHHNYIANSQIETNINTNLSIGANADDTHDCTFINTQIYGPSTNDIVMYGTDSINATSNIVFIGGTISGPITLYGFVSSVVMQNTKLSGATFPVTTPIIINCEGHVNSEIPVSGLLLYAPLEQVTALNRVPNLSVNGIEGTNNGGTVTASGKVGEALIYDGINDLTDFPSTTGITITSTYTFTAWIKLNVSPAGGPFAVFGCRDSMIYIDGSKLKLQEDVTWATIVGNGPTSSGVWYHIAITHAGAGAGQTKLYLNGIQQDDAIAVPNFVTGGNNLRLGSRNGVNYFDGLIDEVRVYNRALTASEISYIMNDVALHNEVIDKTSEILASNSGTGSIDNATTSDIITHGLSYTPTAADITITLTENPTNSPGAIWVDTIGAATFTVNCENDPGASNLDFSWSARKTP